MALTEACHKYLPLLKATFKGFQMRYHLFMYQHWLSVSYFCPSVHVLTTVLVTYAAENYITKLLQLFVKLMCK